MRPRSLHGLFGSSIALGLLGVWVTASGCNRAPSIPAEPVSTPADTLCAIEATLEERVKAAKDAAQAGTLKLALERPGCSPAAHAPGMQQLALVFDTACAGDGCLDLILKRPSDPRTIELITPHLEQITGALAQRSCEIGGVSSQSLVRTLIGPDGTALMTTA